MTTHLDAYLEPCAAFGWACGPQFRTAIESLASGDEYRNAEWIDARHVASLPFQNITAESYRALKRMFFVCRGMNFAFRFQDVLDFEAAGEVIGQGNGYQETFQVCTVSTEDGESYTRNIYALRGTPQIFLDGLETFDFTIDMRRGLVSFEGPPGNGVEITWSGEFDLWVRFATDLLQFSLDDLDATNGSVELIEVAPPTEADE